MWSILHIDIHNRKRVPAASGLEPPNLWGPAGRQFGGHETPDSALAGFLYNLTPPTVGLKFAW